MSIQRLRGGYLSKEWYPTAVETKTYLEIIFSIAFLREILLEKKNKQTK